MDLKISVTDCPKSQKFLISKNILASNRGVSRGVKSSAPPPSTRNFFLLTRVFWEKNSKPPLKFSFHTKKFQTPHPRKISGRPWIQKFQTGFKSAIIGSMMFDQNVNCSALSDNLSAPGSFFAPIIPCYTTEIKNEVKVIW